MRNCPLVSNLARSAAVPPISVRNVKAPEGVAPVARIAVKVAADTFEPSEFWATKLSPTPIPLVPVVVVACCKVRAVTTVLVFVSVINT
jgi:hypothetical protein